MKPKSELHLDGDSLVFLALEREEAIKKINCSENNLNNNGWVELPVFMGTESWPGYEINTGSFKTNCINAVINCE